MLRQHNIDPESYVGTWNVSRDLTAVQEVVAVSIPFDIAKHPKVFIKEVYLHGSLSGADTLTFSIRSYIAGAARLNVGKGVEEYNSSGVFSFTATSENFLFAELNLEVPLLEHDTAQASRAIGLCLFTASTATFTGIAGMIFRPLGFRDVVI